MFSELGISSEDWERTPQAVRTVVLSLQHQLRLFQIQAQMKPIRRRVKALLEIGSRLEAAKTRRVCQNILKVEKSLWTFVRVEGIQPTNNAAERALRRAVLWRRTSFGTQSAAGSRFVERILTIITTLRQQGCDVLDYLTAACTSAQHDDASITLLPGSAQS